MILSSRTTSIGILSRFKLDTYLKQIQKPLKRFIEGHWVFKLFGAKNRIQSTKICLSKMQQLTILKLYY